MAQLDEGVEKLQEFVGLLAATNSRVQQELSSLEAYDSEVGQMEEAVEDTLGGLNGDLEGQLKELAEAEGAAVEEVDKLADLARTVADDRLQDALGHVEERDSAIEERLDSEGNDLYREFSELTSAGFDALATSIDGVQSELTGDGDRSEQAFDGFTDGLQALGQQVDDAQQAATDVFTQAEGDLSGEETDGLESDAAACLTGWSEELPNSMNAECDGVGQELETLYQGFGSDAEAAGDGLIESVSTAFQEASSFLVPETSQPLEGALERATDDVLEPLGGGWQAANEVLAAGASTTDVLEPIVEQLEISKRVVAEVDRALSALE